MTSTGADKCSARTGGGHGSFGSNGGKTSGTDWDVVEPDVGKTLTYTITCTGDGGTAADSISVTNQPDPVTVNLTVKYKGVWGSDDIVGDTRDGINLRWTSTGAERCSAGTQGGHGCFGSNGGRTSGTDWDVDEPKVGKTLTYIITCQGGNDRDPIASDSITVTNQPDSLTADLTVKYKGVWGGAGIVGDMRGGIALKWTSTGADECVSEGDGFSTNGKKTSGTDWNIDEPDVGETETYSVICTGPGGTVGDSIRVVNQPDPITANLTVKYKGQWGSAGIVGDMSGGLAFRLSLIHI